MEVRLQGTSLDENPEEHVSFTERPKQAAVPGLGILVALFHLPAISLNPETGLGLTRLSETGPGPTRHLPSCLMSHLVTNKHLLSDNRVLRTVLRDTGKV